MIVQPFGFNLKKASGGGYQTPTFRSFAAGSPADIAENVVTDTSLSVSSGDFIIAMTARSYTGIGFDTCVCGSNALTKLATLLPEANYPVDVWYVANATATTSVVEATSVGESSNYRQIVAASYSGCALSSPIDQYSSLTLQTAGTTITPANVTTTHSNDLLIALVMGWDNPHTWTATNSYTARVTGTTVYQILDKKVTSTGTYPSGSVATMNSSDQWLAFFVAVKAGNA